MTQPTLRQDPEGIAAGAIWRVAAAIVAIGAALIAIAWLLVAPPAVPHRPVTAASPLEDTLFDRAAAGAALHAAAAARLEVYAWVDRRARVARIPIEVAIAAVAADPRLIAAGSPAIAALSRAQPTSAASDARTSGTTPAGAASGGRTSDGASTRAAPDPRATEAAGSNVDPRATDPAGSRADRSPTQAAAPPARGLQPVVKAVEISQ